MFVITGGAGFIGSAFITKLNQEGRSDIIVVDEFQCSDRWKNLLGKTFQDFIHKDDFLSLLERDALAFAPTAIVHMGACSSTTERDVDFLYRNNFIYTKKLAEYCVKHGIRFVYASSAATYGDGSLGYDDSDGELHKLKPLNPYGFSKQLFDMWARESKLFEKICGIKFFNVFGPNEYHKESMRSVVLKAYYQVKDFGCVKLFRSRRGDCKDGEQKRDFIYVKDCSEVLWWLLQNPAVNGIFNLGTGKARSFNDLVTAVFKALGQKPRIEYIDMPDDVRDQYQYFTEAKIDKLKNSGLQYEFSSLESGVTDYVQNFLEKGGGFL